MMLKLETTEIEPSSPPRAVMIWLHGLGVDGHDLEPVAELLGLGAIRHVLPHAPVRPVTVNGGMAMRAWYDITAPDLRWQEDASGMQQSASAIKSLIETIQGETGLPLILAGFSQGGVISLATAALGVQLLGVVVLSGYLPNYLSIVPAPLRQLPIFMAHGRQDPIIPISLAQAGSQTLLNAGGQVAWHAYDMPHAICAEEIDDMRAAVAGWTRPPT